MPDKKTKSQKIDSAFDKADKVTELAKDYTPDVVDKKIDEYKGLAKAGLFISKLVGGMFKKK